MAIDRNKASFGLARTNPKISGNVKITVDSTGDVWLNTINANRELSSANYKRFRTTKTSNFESDLKKFIGKLPPEVVFQVKPTADPTAISDTFQNQYELFYSMGVQTLISDAYEEDYSYLAPIWLRDQLPEYFVIFRIDEPLDFPYNTNVESGDLVEGTEYKVTGDGYTVVYENFEYSNGDTFTATSTSTYTVSEGNGSIISLNENKDLPLDYARLFDDIVKKGQVVETFDLGPNSKIGQYIRRIKDNPKFPRSPISVRFEDGLLTTWNGISYQSGITVSKGEFLHDYWENAQSQIEFEEFITDGFQRQGIICPFLLNLEFLFDDETVPNYSIPRYYGFYVNKKTTGSFQLSGQKLYDNRSVSGNTPIPKRNNKGYRYQEEDFFQNNEDGVRLYYENPEGIIPNSDFFDATNFEQRMYWIQDKEGKFYSLNQRPDLYVNGDYNKNDTDLVVRNTSINLGSFSGKFDVKLQGEGAYLTENGRSYLTIKVGDEFLPNDKIRIYWNIGTQTDAIGMYDEIIAADLRRYFTVVPGGTVLSIFGNVVANYNLNDEIEITYDPDNVITRKIVSTPLFNGTHTVFSIDSAINNSVSSGYISIINGWGKGSAISAQNNVPIYFHPYGTNSQIASAIAKAFNTLEQRTFDAIAVGDTCVIRMRHGQLSTNSFFGTFNLTIPSVLEVQGQALSLAPNDKYYFEGGTDRATVRMRCSLEDLEKLRDVEVYAKTKLGISKIIHVGRYVDAAVQEEGGSELVGIDGFNDYAVFTIEDNADQPLLGSTKEFITYNLYKIPVGLFSFFNVKDIDGDFWSSGYNRSPINELKRYFNVMPDEDTLVINREYYVFGDTVNADSIVHDGITYYAGSSFVATKLSYSVNGGTPFVVPKVFYQKGFTEADFLNIGSYQVLGDPVLDSVQVFDGITGLQISGSPFYAGTTFNLTNIGRFVKYSGDATVVRTVQPQDRINEMDEDLASFPGFFKFKDFLTVEQDTSNKDSVAFRLNDKFFQNDLSSEYDYLKENFNKDLSIKSRLSQVISKWVYKGGLDVRDNPYRLNTHPVFGQFNFSPSLNIKTQNPDGFTHEWYYLESAPNSYPESLLKDNYYFFYDNLDFAQLSDTDPSKDDYFLDYFSFEPVPNSPMQDRYTIFEFNRETGLCETFFRGAKIRIKEIIRDTRPSELQSIKPPFKDRSTLFDDYKFTAILRTHKERKNVLESPVSIQVVENKTFKNITMIIDVILEDYRTLNLIDPDFLGSNMSPFIDYPDLLDASVDYTLLYSLKNKRKEATFFDNVNYVIRGLDTFKISDIKLSVALDLSAPSGAVGQFTYVNVFDNPDYDWDLRDEVKNFSPSNYFKGLFQYGDTKYPSALNSTQTQVLFGVPFSTPNYPSYPNSSFPDPSTFLAPATPATAISIPYGSNFEWEGFATYVNDGGKLYYEPIMQRISFAKIAEKVNQFSNYIKYRSFEWDGSNSVEVDPNYYIEFEQSSSIMKINSLIPLTDDDKPEEFKNESVIGTVLTQVNSAQIINRYGGPYEPKFRDVFYFKNQTADAIQVAGQDVVDLSFEQATFNSDVDDFGILKNFGYLKVANSDILSLVNNTKYQSVYPLIHEVAIDKMDFPVYLSSWDPGFWRRFINKSTFKFQAGTREMLEVKNFFGAKIMKTPRTINLQTFNSVQVSDIESINPQTFVDEVVYAILPGSETNISSKIVGYINISERLRRYLIEDGADREFIKYLIPEFGVGDPDVLSDDVVNYLNLNVLPTYEVKQFVPYVKYFKEENSGIPAVRTDLTDSQKFTNNYRLEKNFTTNKLGDYLYRFEFIVSANTNASISFSIDVGKI